MSRVIKKEVYLDNAAATPIDPIVQKTMFEAGRLYANPSSFNNAGRTARDKINEARSVTAKFIGAKAGEVVFTSSGSEANNLAIFGLANSFSKPAEIITTPIEHPSVLEPLNKLKDKGWKVTLLKVNPDGLVDIKDLEIKLNPRVALVSIIYANNEIGTIQPIVKMSKVVRRIKGRYGTPFLHVDACQATGCLNMNVNNLGVDSMCFNGSKIYGPRGIGVLYVRNSISIKPIIFGGDQENGLRAGTENLPAILGMAKAVSLIQGFDSKKIAELRDYFLGNIIKTMPDIRINGAKGSDRLSGNINISVPDMSSENILLELDRYGIYASSGSACTARSVEPSHVLQAIGVEKKYLNGALRFSLGRQTTKKDIDYVLMVLPKVVGDLRNRYRR